MSVRRRAAGLAAAGLAVLLASAPAAGQERVAVFAEPGTPVIATEVLIAVGPADEDSVTAGVAYLAARAVTEPIQPLLDSLEAHLAVRAGKDAIAFSLIAAPDTWTEVSRALLVALFRDPADSLAVARERALVREELLGRGANPADAMTRAADAAFFGAGHPWSRSTVGTSASVGRLRYADVDAFLRARFTPERTVAVVVGPVDPEAARGHLRTYLEASGPLPVVPRAARPAEGTVRQNYNSITTWVSTSFPIGVGADAEALRLAAYLVREELLGGPGRHRLFDVSSEVSPRLGTSELRFQLVTPPGEAESWADRVREAMDGLVEAPMLRADWEAKLRRYRGDRLLGLNAPEDRAHAAARQLLVEGRVEALIPDLDGLTLARVRDAVASLGPPTVVFLGPFLEEDGKD